MDSIYDYEWHNVNQRQDIDVYKEHFVAFRCNLKLSRCFNRLCENALIAQSTEKFLVGYVNQQNEEKDCILSIMVYSSYQDSLKPELSLANDTLSGANMKFRFLKPRELQTIYNETFDFMGVNFGGTVSGAHLTSIIKQLHDVNYGQDMSADDRCRKIFGFEEANDAPGNVCTKYLPLVDIRCGEYLSKEVAIEYMQM